MLPKRSQRIEVANAIKAFIQDRKSQALARGSIKFYQEKLKIFNDFCAANELGDVLAIEADQLRTFFLEQIDIRSIGGVHTIFRTVHAFYNWVEEEYEPDPWRNPMARLKAPHVEEELLDPVSYETLRALVEACPPTEFGLRDKAIFLFLMDTGVRAFELCALNRDDIDMITRTVTIKKGKGGRPRSVFLKKKSKSALRAYFTARADKQTAAFLGLNEERLKYDGLRAIVRRRSDDAGIEHPKIHGFRRAFALNCVRAGVDILTLQRLMGHRSLEATRRYVKQTDEDLKNAADTVPEDDES